MNGVIWSKTQKTFVPISSVPAFAEMQQERLRQSRALETHNFQLQNLTLTSFQEPRFFEFYDNDTKVTGLCGELWNLLSENLNFTLQPIRSNESSLGASQNKTIFVRGLLGVITRNETFAIPKVETYSLRLLATDFTMPLWMNKNRLYIQQEIIHDSTWMAKVFSWKIWCFMLVMYLVLSVCSFWSQIIFERIGNNCRHSSIGEHIFYNFGMICNQSYIPDNLIGRSKIIEVSLGLFCSIMSMSFGALLFLFIAKRINILPPFNNLDSMLADSIYNVVSLKGSVGHIAITASPENFFIRVRTARRFVIASTVEEMFQLACRKGKKKKYTILQGEDEYKTRGQIKCYMTPIGESYLRMWIASGIVKNCKYKRSIDLGILKLKEVGLWKALTERWMAQKRERHENMTMEPIEMDQVILIILIMCCGTIMAIIIFIIEKIVYKLKSL
ncbi:PREDICTED: uncharacterized protein LOC105460889 [Wasmannia auropunctata]|uniref:uncharacterized protein LOC105460889 n=1 Tax=Wasmannia auropunctata TaxID=64793 RepID=UPI0005EF5DD0|nr:PREDICTED: uncharacterized protein LOC105460889 [Wasmannia auropunctata]